MAAFLFPVVFGSTWRIRQRCRCKQVAHDRRVRKHSHSACPVDHPLNVICHRSQREICARFGRTRSCRRKRRPNSLSVNARHHLARRGTVQTALDTLPNARTRPGVHRVGPETSWQEPVCALRILPPRRRRPDLRDTTPAPTKEHRFRCGSRSCQPKVVEKHSRNEAKRPREGNLFRRDHRVKDARGPGAEPGPRTESQEPTDWRLSERRSRPAVRGSFP